MNDENIYKEKKNIYEVHFSQSTNVKWRINVINNFSEINKLFFEKYFYFIFYLRTIIRTCVRYKQQY